MLDFVRISSYLCIVIKKQTTMKTITLTSKYFGTETTLRISAEAYNKLANSDEEDRMLYLLEAAEFAKHGIETMLSMSQVRRLNRRLTEGDYYNQVTI